MKKITIISSTMRSGGNSEILAKEFEKGALESGNEVNFISLKGKGLQFCRGCLACQSMHSCVINDDANEIARVVGSSDVVVFATPIYYYEMSGQLKTLLDRMNPLFGTDYKFRDIYFIATAADEDASAMDGALHGLQGWLDCFPKTELKGIVKGLGATDTKDILSNKNVLHQAYDFGKNA